MSLPAMSTTISTRKQVGEYEKKCLSSDVNLAEVSCVHQILSLLGQKVHVPAEAKARMYQLVKGRESTPAIRRDGVKPAVRVPVTEPIQPWVAPAPPPRHWLERFGPVAGCLALLAVLCWSAYQSLTPPPPATSTVGNSPATHGSRWPGQPSQVRRAFPLESSSPRPLERIAGAAVPRFQRTDGCQRKRPQHEEATG